MGALRSRRRSEAFEQAKSSTPSIASALRTLRRLSLVAFWIEDETLEKLDEAKIHELYQENASKLLTTCGVTEQDVIQRLQQGKKVVLGENCTIDPFDSTLFAEQKNTKRFAILGDTSDARSMLPLLKQTDLLVHESTVIPLQKELRTLQIAVFLFNKIGGRSMEDIEAIVRESGHSTARMAGAFAKECEAKRLVLTHISSRYPANSKRFDSPEMRELRELAVVRSMSWR